MKEDKERMTGYPDWAQKSWWVKPDESILTEYLKVLTGIKKNVPNISARIHEVCTIITQQYLSNLMVGKITKIIKGGCKSKSKDGTGYKN